MARKKDINFVDQVLDSALNNAEDGTSKLKSLFVQKLLETRISFNQAAVNMGVDNKLLEKILDGDITLFDTIALPKISRFLDIPLYDVTGMFFSMVETQRQGDLAQSAKNSYIINTFDLPLLKKIKFIKSITDISEIDARIRHFFDLSTIEEYKNEAISVAYSSGARKSKSGFSKSFWLRTAQALLAGVENPYSYDRDKLLDYIPQIRWHSTDIDNGLYQVVRSLYKLGVTVIYVPPIHDAHVRGSTIAHKAKPCIIITNYTDFYPTLFFVLLHELFHVLFDWEEISINQYHVSNDDNYYTNSEKEANDFARDFFASEEDLNAFCRMDWDEQMVNEFAGKNNIHPSFYYLFNAFAKSKEDPKIWGRIRKYIPSAALALSPLVGFSWNTQYSIKQINEIRNKKIYDL